MTPSSLHNRVKTSLARHLLLLFSVTPPTSGLSPADKPPAWCDVTVYVCFLFASWQPRKLAFHLTKKHHTPHIRGHSSYYERPRVIGNLCFHLIPMYCGWVILKLLELFISVGHAVNSDTWMHFNVTVACVFLRCIYGGKIKRYLAAEGVRVGWGGVLSLAPVKLRSKNFFLFF